MLSAYAIRDRDSNGRGACHPHLQSGCAYPLRASTEVADTRERRADTSRLRARASAIEGVNGCVGNVRGLPEVLRAAAVRRRQPAHGVEPLNVSDLGHEALPAMGDRLQEQP